MPSKELLDRHRREYLESYKILKDEYDIEREYNLELEYDLEREYDIEREYDLELFKLPDNHDDCQEKFDVNRLRLSTHTWDLLDFIHALLVENPAKHRP